MTALIWGECSVVMIPEIVKQALRTERATECYLASSVATLLSESIAFVLPFFHQYIFNRNMFFFSPPFAQKLVVSGQLESTTSALQYGQ